MKKTTKQKMMESMPKVPRGYSEWECKGWGWDSGFNEVGVPWCVWKKNHKSWEEYPGFAMACGDEHGCYYVAIKHPTKKPKPASKGRVVAKRMWTCGSNITTPKHRAKYYGGFAPVSPVFVLPADKASVEAMVEQVAKVLGAAHELSSTRIEGSLARAVLKAIGIQCKKKAKQ